MSGARCLPDQLQFDALQPFLRQVVTWFNYSSVPLKYSQIVRVPDDLGLPMEPTAGWPQVPSVLVLILPRCRKYEVDKGLECPIVQPGNGQGAPSVCSRIRNLRTSGGIANWQLGKMSR
jgi:hypothetical protein